MTQKGFAPTTGQSDISKNRQKLRKSVSLNNIDLKNENKPKNEASR